jgi:hypothetical protein
MFSGDESDSYGELEGDFDSSAGSGDDTKSDLIETSVTDKQWLARFLQDHLKKLQTGVETELTDIKNKKKGRNSKNKEKVSALMKKLEGWKKVRDRAEELTISMDYLEQGTLKELRSRARNFLSAPDEEEPRISVVEEIENLIELSEQNRRKQSSFAMFSNP